MARDALLLRSFFFIFFSLTAGRRGEFLAKIAIDAAFRIVVRTGFCSGKTASS